jgi:ATP-dependent helicase/nuclease subunit A
VTFRPVDHEARQRARTDHETSLVLEAAAGTGKTTLLVDRIEALVRSGRVRLEEVAAVTFTENAATTMKLRLRERLEAARVDTAATDVERARAAAALDVLERSQISTIHALCAAILGERPLDCGVVPGFRVADEAEMEVLFGLAWDEWLTGRLVARDPALLLALDNFIPFEAEGYAERTSLRGLARTLVEQRDLRPLVAETAPDPEAWRRELDAQADRARTLLGHVRDGDGLGTRLSVLVAFAERARGLEGDALLAHLGRLAVIPGNYGFRPRWSPPEMLDEGRKVAEWTRTAASTWNAALSARLHGRLVTALLGVGALYEQRKAERGVLDFVDLLIKTRDALRDRDAVRRHFRERFRVLLIDEFQDTDPLQVEIAELLSRDVRGGLVVVGDAKQSIYRFRRAEVGLFRRMSEQARERPGHAVLRLSQNFRSRPAILRFVNRVFSEVIQPSVEAGQPAYEAAEPPPGLPEEPSVLALHFPAPFDEGEDLLKAESAALAALISRVAAGAYEVRDPVSGDRRRSQAGDVMVLTRRLTQVRHLEEALEAASLRFTVEGGKSFFDRQEVHEVLSVLRAVDDPADRVSLVAALRSSFFGVSDRDITAYSLAGGGLWMGGVDDGKPGASTLGPALALLADLHRRRTRESVPAILERLYDETRILAALTGGRRGESQVANLEKVGALARKAADLGVLTLRGFTNLLQERLRTAREEPDLPSTRPGDPHTVRILSIHKAKGLEAPVVALYDSADDFLTSPSSIALWEEGTIAVGFRKGCQPPGWEALTAREDARNRAEGKRLLYVACTRARDFLVVPVPPADAHSGSFWRDVVERLPPGGGDADVSVVDATTLPAPPPPEPGPNLRELAAAEGGDPLAARWNAARRELIVDGGYRPFVPVSATRFAARTAPAAVVPAPGEGGRDFGKLVHKLLEWTPLDRPEGVGAMASAIAPAFGLDAATAGRAAEAARRALDLPVMRRARDAQRLWREMPVWFPEGEDLVEGVVDLVFEEGGALVVVDYKTDHIAPGQAVDQAAHHAPQIQLYARGLAQALGMPVRERLVLFTALGTAVPV